MSSFKTTDTLSFHSKLENKHTHCGSETCWGYKGAIQHLLVDGVFSVILRVSGDEFTLFLLASIGESYGIK